MSKAIQPRKRAPGAGRKPEGRVRVVLRVLPATRDALLAGVCGAVNTPGKVADKWAKQP